MSHGKVIPTKYRFEKMPDGAYHVKGCCPGKITGTYFSHVVGRSPWGTPFSAAAHILGLFKEDIGDQPAVKTGVVLEPVILKYVADQGVLPACQVFGNPEDYNEYGQHVGSHDTWKHDFDDPIFGGHVDGITEDGRIVEVKTTSAPEEWLKGVPEHYWLQASLYAKGLGATAIKFVVGFVTEEDRSNPWKWKPEGNVVIFDVELHPKTDEYMETCRQWYDDFIKKNRTPVPDLSNPIDLFVVQSLDAQLLTQDEMFALVDEYTECEERIAELDPIVKRKDELKSQIMIFLQKNDAQYITGTKRAYKRMISKRTIVDTDKLKKDGLYDQYTKQSESESFRATKM